MTAPKKVRMMSIPIWCTTCGNATKFTAAGTEATTYGDGHYSCKECGKCHPKCPGCPAFGIPIRIA